MKLLIFPFGSVKDPSSRHRAFNVAEQLKTFGVEVRVCGPKLGLQRHANALLKLASLAKNLKWCDILYFQKAAHPVTYSFLKRAKRLGRKVVFDVDDAEFLRQHGGWFKKFITQADLVVVASHYLLGYCRRLNRNVVLIPTSVDVSDYVRKRSYGSSGKAVIGWTGTAGNISYLRICLPALQQLSKKYDVMLRVITDWRNVAMQFPSGIKVEKLQWSLSTPRHLAGIDIGIMPLPDDDWAKGKAAFKAIEFMASKVPVVASAVGENEFVVKDNFNGFLCRSSREWRKKLERLVKDAGLRKQFGNAGFSTIAKNYSLRHSALKLKRQLAMLLRR